VVAVVDVAAADAAGEPAEPAEAAAGAGPGAVATPVRRRRLPTTSTDQVGLAGVNALNWISEAARGCAAPPVTSVDPIENRWRENCVTSLLWLESFASGQT
jgi:hypothetical protein